MDAINWVASVRPGQVLAVDAINWVASVLLYTKMLQKWCDLFLLLQGVVQWWKHDPSERFEHLKPLISKISLEQVPLEDLLSFKTDPLLAGTDLGSQIKEAVKLILEQEDEKHEINTCWGLCHRKSLRKERHSMEQEV